MMKPTRREDDAGSREVPMRRREFVVNLGLAGAWPLVAQAQPAER
jgi:hypothetical protein